MVASYFLNIVSIWCTNYCESRKYVCSIYLYNFLILSFFKNKLQTSDGIFLDPSFDETTKKVISFYNKNPFPNYNVGDNKSTILAKGDNSYLKYLKKFIGFNKKMLEVGCGTGQYSNYFAIGTNNIVYALDPTLNSLKLAKSFSDKNNIKNIKYINGSIFEDIFNKESFDFVFCSGVLHHTKDTYLGFKRCSELVKKNGYILIGLYNSYSRFSIKKILYKLFGKKIIIKLDPILREKKNSDAAIDAWIKDQYDHPVERAHSIDELLNWFKSENIKPISGIPNINSLNISEINSNIENQSLYLPKSKFEKIFSQIKMNFNLLGTDAALFCILGKKL